MAIPFNRYVSIISGVGGGTAVRQRDFILRIFSTSQFISPDSVLEFDNAADVGTFFGASSEEFARASAYFAYVSPSIASPRKIGYARNSIGGNDAMVIGNNDFKSLAAFQLVTAGQFDFHIGDTSTTVDGINLSTATTLAEAATLIQTAIRAEGGDLAAATVTFGTTRPSGFTIGVPGLPDGTTVAVTSNATGTGNLADLMGVLVSDGGLNISASDIKTPLESFMRAEQITNNFGSFVFQGTQTLANVTALAQYNAGQNVMYQYHVGVLPADAVDWSAAVIGFAGVGLTLSPKAGQYPEQVPCAILAATEYNRRNSVQNYMFKQYGGIDSTVSNATDANKYDGLRVNYYGDTSTAGQTIKFYQRGTLMGGGTAPVDMNVYANEQWLKDYAGSQIMSLLLSVARVPANNEGKGMLLNILQPVINQALFNGTISTGKTLTAVQKVYITQQTGDGNAWQSVQSAGYVLSLTIEPYTTTSGATEYKAVYQLIYSKDDAVRKVEGSHQLI